MTGAHLAARSVDANVTSIIWATGYAAEYGWLNVDAFDANGRPRHQQQGLQRAGVYFLGLPWLSWRGSAFLWKLLWHDARSIAGH